jgi:hypothetical protein
MSSAFSVGMRLTIGALGTASFGVGTVAVFRGEDGAGTAVLIAFGGAALALALLGERIESLEFGGTKLRLRAAAAERFALAEASERRGDPGEADRLRVEARALLEAAGPVAADYRSTRASMRGGPERTRALEGVVGQARRLAREGSFDPVEVGRWLREGTEDERITAIGMMQASPGLRDFDGVLDAIRHPRSPFEQYHALRLALDMIGDLDRAQRQQLTEVVSSARDRRFRRDNDRWLLSEEILRRTSETG